MTQSQPTANEPAQEIADTLKVEFQDAMTRIFAEMNVAGCLTLVLDFDSPLDVEAVQLAARRILDAEPILGCWMDTSAKQPLWRRHGDLDSSFGFRFAEVADPGPRETDAILSEPWSVDTNRNLETILLRHRGGDRLYLRVSHVIADGGAMVEIAAIFARIYTGIVKDREFRLPPNPATRDSFTWLRAFSFRQKLKIVARDFAEMRKLRKTFGGLKMTDVEETRQPPIRPQQALVTVPADRLAEWDRIANAHRVTRNDLILAGFTRAYARFAGADPSEPIQLAIPNNLRRYADLEPRPAINNLGGVANLFVMPGWGGSFLDTLEKVSKDMARLRAAFLGAPNPIALRVFDKMSFARKRKLLRAMMDKAVNKAAPPVLSSIGRVRERRMSFAGQKPASLWVAGFALGAPMCIVVSIEYAGQLVISMTYDAQDYAPEAVQEFLSNIVAEIPDHSASA